MHEKKYDFFDKKGDKMIKELTEYYIPEKVLHRDEQTKEIEAVFKNFKKQGMASNILIQGVTGSGKTTVINKIIQKENNSVFGSGSTTKTSFRTLRAMFDINCNTNERLLTEIVSRLHQTPKIIIIDEVNKIQDRNNLFNDLNTIYRETGCPIILITNKRTIREEMPDDARLTLMFDRVDFPAYNAIELFDIIKSRLDLLQEKAPKIPQGSLRKICAIGGKEASARVVLQITLKCLLANNFTETYIDKVRKNLEREDWKDFFINLKPTEKDFLRNLVDLKARGTIIKPSSISKAMIHFTPARISQLITAFEDYGIVETKWRNQGRGGGRARIIDFSNDHMFKVFDELV